MSITSLTKVTHPPPTNSPRSNTSFFLSKSLVTLPLKEHNDGSRIIVFKHLFHYVNIAKHCTRLFHLAAAKCPASHRPSNFTSFPWIMALAPMEKAFSLSQSSSYHKPIQLCQCFQQFSTQKSKDTFPFH